MGGGGTMGFVIRVPKDDWIIGNNGQDYLSAKMNGLCRTENRLCYLSLQR